MVFYPKAELKMRRVNKENLLECVSFLKVLRVGGSGPFEEALRRHDQGTEAQPWGQGDEVGRGRANGEGKLRINYVIVNL